MHSTYNPATGSGFSCYGLTKSSFGHYGTLQQTAGALRRCPDTLHCRSGGANPAECCSTKDESLYGMGRLSGHCGLRKCQILTAQRQCSQPTGNRERIHVHQPLQYDLDYRLTERMLTPSEMRWGFGLPMKEINLPEEQILHHYFVDLWADMCMVNITRKQQPLTIPRDVYFLRRAFQVCDPRLLLEDVFHVDDTTTDSYPLRVLSRLDHCEGMPTVLHYSP
jgi:hypothetical protein